MFSDLTYIAVVVLVPLIPAFLLYKFLPHGRTEVGGPFKGLDIKLSGAFAGYFLVVLIVTSLVVFLIKTKPVVPCPVCPTPPATQYEVYTVTGKVDLEGDSKSPKIDSAQLTFSILPPERTVKPDGSFSLQIPVRPGQNGEPEFPDLIIGHEDSAYDSATIPLDEKSPYKRQDFTVVYNKVARTIVLKPAIRLTAATQAFHPQAIVKPIP
ncbi:MAG: hypothetical protein DMF70_06195 [Acidobacteria bacterium]|nr:MAG: hypothetical protein DMF70_06195 [Acidobacteriota bacterium]